jgi:protocatechuate 3,4-dioxygenase beta subunit
MKRDGRIAVRYLAVVLIAVPVGQGWCAGAAPVGPATFTGRVLNAAGRPIEGVKVRLYQQTYESTSYPREATVVAEATAQADGSFSLNAPPQSDVSREGSVVAEKEGLALGFVTWDMKRDLTFDLTLGEPNPLAGVVVDEQGQPVPDAAVSVYLLQIDKDVERYGLSMCVAPRLLTTRTDSTGRFEFANLPAGASAELLVRKPGRATVCTFAVSEFYGGPLHCPAGQTDIRVTQPVEARLQGVVVQKQTGQAVGGITLVMTYAPNRSIEGYAPIDVSADGTFTMPALPAGQYALQLATRKGELPDWVAAPVPVTLKAGEARTDLKIEVSKGAILEVAVTDAADHQPIEKASASARASQGGQWFSSISDADGVARLRLAPGTYEIGVYRQGYSHEARSRTVTIEEGIAKHVDMALTRMPRIGGSVRDAGGAPVAGAQVRILPAGRQDATTDAEGKFEITWDGQARHRGTTLCLVARHVQRNLAAVAEIAEGTKTLDVKLEPGIVIAGRVVDPNGKGIAGAQVSPMLSMSGWGSSLNEDGIPTDRSGSFEIRAVPAGHKYDLDVRADGYGNKTCQNLDSYGVKDRLDVGVVTLPVANLVVSGQVVDLQDKPVPNASLHVYGDDQPGGRAARTDADGRFTLKGVCAGALNIEAYAGRGGKELSAVALTEGGSTDIRIVMREGPSPVQRVGGKGYEQIVATATKVIAGVAVDEKGAPVADVPVQVCCRKTMREGRMTWIYSSFRELSATTDDRGRFAIELKEDGEYNLRFSPDRQAAVIVYDVPVGKKDLQVTLPEGGTVTGRLVRIEKGHKIAIPNAEIKVEQTSRWAFSHLGFDRDRQTVTDAEGRFRVEHLATQIRPIQDQAGFVPRSWKVSHGDNSETIVFDGDATTKDVELVVRPDLADAPPLQGNPLPGFDGIALDLTPEQIQGKRVLVCFFDWEQRPSRNCLLQLARQTRALREKGVTLVGVHVARDNEAGLRQWVADSKIPFPVGMIQGDREEVLFTWSAKSLPWLVLTDANHIVTAEGFAPSALDENLGVNAERETE